MAPAAPGGVGLSLIDLDNQYLHLPLATDCSKLRCSIELLEPLAVCSASCRLRTAGTIQWRRLELVLETSSLSHLLLECLQGVYGSHFVYLGGTLLTITGKSAGADSEEFGGRLGEKVNLPLRYLPLLYLSY
jgi:hypothetical protein